MKPLILFVHGLGGNKHTWVCFQDLIISDIQFFSDYEIKFFTYETKLFGVKRWIFPNKIPTINLIRDVLHTEIKEKYQTYQKIIFVTHSLGGLIAMSYILKIGREDDKTKTYELLMYSPPLNGSKYADIAVTLGLANRQVRQLKRKGEGYITLMNELLSTTTSKCRTKFVIGTQDEVVNNDSLRNSKLPLDIASVQKGHLDIIRPDSKDDASYFTFLQFLKEGNTEEIQIPLLSARIDLITENNNIDCDSFPKNSIWVGREAEIESLKNSDNNAIFITGLEGEGKQGLVSRFIDVVCKGDSEWEFWDWRDFKNSHERFRDKLINIIERLTNRGVLNSELKELTFAEIVDLLLKIAKLNKILFVFSNVDEFVSPDGSDFKEDIKVFIETIIRSECKSKFIFICKHALIDRLPKLFHLHLEGITRFECLLLAKAYKIQDTPETINHINKIYDLTKGHVQALNMIFAQIRPSGKKLPQIIKDVSDCDGISNCIPSIILDNVWNVIDQQKKLIMLFLSVLDVPLAIDEVEKILNKKFNSRSMKKDITYLTNINLLKKYYTTSQTLEISVHLLVKKYVLRICDFADIEIARDYLISQYIIEVKDCLSTLDSSSPLRQYNNCLRLMKLYKSAGDSILALLLLKKICISMLNDGYNKEYISTCIDLFQNLNFNEFLSNWRERVCLDNPDFCKTLSFDTSKDSVQDAFMLVFHIFINELIKASMYNEVESYLDQYKNYINENSIHFAEYCSLQCIYYWYSKRFQDSIDWGEKFMLIKSRLNITDPHQTELYLALSLRDTRDPQNIKKALKYLLFGNTIDSLLRRPISKYFDKEEYYGNLGRCMQLLKQYDYALTAYMLSYRLVSGHITYNTKYNKAFLFQWLGEVYHEIGKDDFALVFLKVSRCYWEELMNSSYWEVDKLYQAISEHFEGHTSIDTISKIGLENKVDQIIKERIHDVTNGVI